MTTAPRIAVFAAGAALFAYLVAHLGARQLAADAWATGWMIVPILLVWALVYLCNAGAWRTTMAGEPRRPSLWATWVMTASGFALNFVTPVLNVGGEPFKAATLTGWLPVRRAATSVIIHKLLHTLGHLLFWLTALIIALAAYARSAAEAFILSVALAGVGALAVVLWTVHRNGGLVATVRLIGRLPLARRVARGLTARRSTILEMDRQIVEFYRASPRRFFQALGLEYLSRLVGALEYYLIFVSLNLPASYLAALLVSSLLSLALNLTFVVPFEVGTKEAMTYLLFARLGLNPDLGVFAAIITRVRDLAWIVVGLALVWLAGARPAPAAPAEPAT